MKSVTRYFRNAVAASMQGTVNYKKERFFHNISCHGCRGELAGMQAPLGVTYLGCTRVSLCGDKNRLKNMAPHFEGRVHGEELLHIIDIFCLNKAFAICC